ncbi:alkylation response protein AidB-like acyl-CoA dehydrogenase [Rhizobium mesoamericanum]|uniref:acyl-CoA dehydrogenase C-terminal domain-containing protein n=1 Tax=Rhizobium mesoamericanum TaxID=1079800 RepID=UPI0027875F73|nr:acyl-CoA dehydrogenase C-terminal domain-containing protein [Rhizobium mesoamericanum]MDQ0564195.1 alkylation response protein AidB-like acyl-CoA dehydrogenase [Rhizobium mesoamericanum]
MAGYIPPIEDVSFLLGEVFDFNAQMAALPGFEEVDADLATSVLEEAGKFCAEVLEPLNRPGDEEGCHLENGLVTTPKGFADAYRAFVEAGWGGLSGDPEFGGQGLPRALQILFDEMLSSTNLSFGLFPGLTRGAVEAIAHHGSEELKQKYLPKMISGEWTGAMALTESSAGTDLGLLTSRAEPLDDGSYAIRGTKIFISSGDQDFGGNIVHLVLARLPDAPKGVKGISLFLAPKFLVNDDGSLGERNRMSVGSLEHKMGIHAQPTCVMNYDGAIGWLVGEPGRGLNAMFTMMNAERLFVGIQGLGIGEAANQKAVAYARERLQGRSADGGCGPVPIIDHADVRKMLLTGRALTDAGRALGVWTAIQMDIAARHPDETVRQKANGFVALLTPVVKAAFTDFGFETAVLSQQVFGGHGYIRESGIEQHVRDARITQIYEGTNGVQAMDLVGRKLPMEDGDLPRRFFKLIRGDLAVTAVPAELEMVSAAVGEALARLEKLTEYLLAKDADLDEAGAAATDYLRFFALVSFGWLWVLMASKAAASAGASSLLKQRKLSLARFFASRLLPQTAALDTAIRSGAATLMALDAELF